MLSIQETLNKTEKQLKAIKEVMDKTGCYHPEDASIYDGLNVADRYEIEQTLKTTPLREIIAKSGTTGIGGAAYLIAPKLHDDLIAYSKPNDLVPLIGRVITGWDGGDLAVNIMDDMSYRPVEFSSSGYVAGGQVVVKKATIAPISFGIDLAIGNDLIEDNAYDLIDWHVQKAALTMGNYSSELALTVLKTATDGWGTVVGGASGDADETKWAGGTTFSIVNTTAAKSIIGLLAENRWVPNTIITTSQAWEHSLSVTGSALANNIGLIGQLRPPAEGFQCVVDIPPLDLLINNNRALHAWAIDGDTGAMTNCVTIVFDRNNAILTGRKRWLEIKNYANPYEDLAGATITARQDSVTLYNDAIGVITET